MFSHSLSLYLCVCAHLECLHYDYYVSSKHDDGNDDDDDIIIVVVAVVNRMLGRMHLDKLI